MRIVRPSDLLSASTRLAAVTAALSALVIMGLLAADVVVLESMLDLAAVAPIVACGLGLHALANPNQAPEAALFAKDALAHPADRSPAAAHSATAAADRFDPESILRRHGELRATEPNFAVAAASTPRAPGPAGSLVAADDDFTRIWNAAGGSGAVPLAIHRVYERGDSAKLWGSMVNTSRTLARQIVNLLGPAEGDDERHRSREALSPYPVSRLAPTHDLVDTARQIAEADQILGTVVHGKLSVIAEQIRALQEQARRVLAEAQEDAALHRARCSFQKRVGHTYHLYTRPDGSSWLSMLGPAEWRGAPPHAFVGSYRLEPDMSWTPVGAAEPHAARPTLAELRALTGVDGG